MNKEKFNQETKKLLQMIKIAAKKAKKVGFKIVKVEIK